ncbi:hypothetical protein, partial [Latilactobacillus curvatus]|uniref:hypothetical protein n=1 Tax=Latilactobacillus curvatus TaxID=28038 RepID=UPI00280C0469
NVLEYLVNIKTPDIGFWSNIGGSLQVDNINTIKKRLSLNESRLTNSKELIGEFRYLIQQMLL